MNFAGTEIPAGAAAHLAVRLQQAGEAGLAQRVGIAVDTGHDMQLTNLDRRAVLRVLALSPGELR
jgi:pyridoxine 5'-phosphate synthase PdxJ